MVLKLPHGEPPSPRAREELKHEHAVLRALEVPGVIRALGLEEHDRKPVLVLEPWGDTSLARVLEQGPLPVGVALRLGAALSRSLGEVHRRGILHRDIKPHNILVDAERTHTCLIDFGLATCWTPQLAAQTSLEAVSGTLAYMAPEQTGRMNRAPDARADLYALGATLYQMLTGALPFEATDTLELIHAHIARAPVPPHERAPERNIPEAVSAIVLKLMAKSPEDRYQTAERRGLGFGAGGAGVGRDGDGGAVSAGEARLGRSGPRAVAPVRSGARERRARGAVRRGVRRRDGARAGGGAVGRGQVGAGAGAAGRGARAAGASSPPASSTSCSAARRMRRWRRRCGRWCGGGSADPAEVLERWRQAFQEAAGPDGQILVELMPELVHILGEPKPLVELGPMEAKLRFQTTVLRFVRTLATAEHPLVLFIDDLQWADAGVAFALWASC